MKKILKLRKIDTTTWDTMLTGLKNKTWTRYVGISKHQKARKGNKVRTFGDIRKNIKSKLTGINFITKDAVLELNAMYPTLLRNT